MPYIRCAAAMILAAVLSDPMTTAALSAEQAVPQQATTPTLAETLTWLKDTMVSAGGYDYAPADFASCTISYVIVPGSKWSRRDAVNLSEVDATKITAEPRPDWGMSPETRATLTPTQLHDYQMDRPDPNSGRLFYVNLQDKQQRPKEPLIFTSMDVATRVTKALQHAVSLCTKQPF